MTIVCGTDFSESSATAARVAAAIAKRLALPLKLVHAIDDSGAEWTARRSRETYEPLQARLDAEAERLRAELAVDVESLVETGAADERLVALASSLDARLLVVGSLGARKQSRWLLGSVAERVAQSSPIAVLVIRDGGSIEAWARGEGALRVLVGVELTPASHAALQWARELRAIGPCELIVAHIVWPAEEQRRAGISTPIPLDHLRAELEHRLVRELRQWAGEQPDSSDTSFIVRAGWGRVDSHITQLAAEHTVDLLVVGTHQRAGVARLWQGSVSRGVLHVASTAVACIPGGNGFERR